MIVDVDVDNDVLIYHLRCCMKIMKMLVKIVKMLQKVQSPLDQQIPFPSTFSHDMI